MENKRFELSALKYNLDALEPIMSRETLELHWGRHLRAYIDNLNDLIEGTRFEGAPLDIIVKESEGATFNNAGQVYNHQVAFDTLSPTPKTSPTGALAIAIDDTFGSFESLRKEFKQRGLTLFGSGWVWLSKDANGGLVITQEVNAGNPLRQNLKPLFCIDVWEHAYYVDYRNRRADYLAGVWQLIDWSTVERAFER
ncbi:MAG: superoxide dismutase [Rikenellaceae bacterium]